MLLVFGTACGGHSGQYTVAVGYSGSLYQQRSCDASSVKPKGLVQKNELGYFDAVAPGKARIECGPDEVVLDIRPVAQLRVRAPSRAAPGKPFLASLEAFDAQDQPLQVGDHAEVSWQLSGPLEVAGCEKIHPHSRTSECDEGQTKLVATRAGTGMVTVRFGGQQAQATVQVGP